METGYRDSVGERKQVGGERATVCESECVGGWFVGWTGECECVPE